MKVLITGVAGFIGYFVAARLLSLGSEVVGVDNLNDYYDQKLKADRLARLENSPEKAAFSFRRVDLTDMDALSAIFADGSFTHVINMAAQAGVRYSLRNPASYVGSNLVGFGNLLECCRLYPPKHLVFASSSSVYGLNAARPYSIHTNVDHPVSLYAATKKSGELMAHAYSHLFNLPATGLRFFTVYGPWGRPDMALYLFTTAILKGEPLKVFNNGQLRRDFTYIDDIVEGVIRILEKPAAPNPEFDPVAPDPASSSAPWRIYNIGANHTVSIGEFIETLEKALGKKAVLEMLPAQPGDVESTWADVKSFELATGYKPATTLAEGIGRYVEWYKGYYGGRDASR